MGLVRLSFYRLQQMALAGFVLLALARLSLATWISLRLGFFVDHLWTLILRGGPFVVGVELGGGLVGRQDLCAVLSRAPRRAVRLDFAAWQSLVVTGNRGLGGLASLLETQMILLCNKDKLSWWWLEARKTPCVSRYENWLNDFWKYLFGNLGSTSSELVVCHNVARLLRQVRRIQWLLGWSQSCKNVRTTSTIDLFSLFWLKMDWLSLRCCRRACPPLLQVNQSTPVADH